MEIHSQNYRFSLPEKLTQIIFNYLEKQDKFKKDSKAWAAWIMHLSDIYIHEEVQRCDIWNKPEMRWAYLLYFLPLNFLRQSYVWQELVKLDLLPAHPSICDFGSGCGTTELAYRLLVDSSAEFANVEINPLAIDLHRDLLAEIGYSNQSIYPKMDRVKDRSVLMMSYSFNELEEPPKWLNDFETLVFIDPSTHKQGRRLMQLRQKLLAEGFYSHSPCTHQGNCPLLEHSQKDWCHQTIEFEQPSWWQELEKHLPIKNQELSFSYLILSKKTALPTLKARVIGHALKEKGKTKQLICRGEEREFMSWLKRDKKIYHLHRGDLIELPKEINKKGNEIRLK